MYHVTDFLETYLNIDQEENLRGSRGKTDALYSGFIGRYG